MAKVHKQHLLCSDRQADSRIGIEARVAALHAAQHPEMGIHHRTASLSSGEISGQVSPIRGFTEWIGFTSQSSITKNKRVQSPITVGKHCGYIKQQYLWDGCFPFRVEKNISEPAKKNWRTIPSNERLKGLLPSDFIIHVWCWLIKNSGMTLTITIKSLYSSYSINTGRVATKKSVQHNFSYT